MIVLGADTHKRSHTVAAIAAGTGELLGERTVAVGRRGFRRVTAVGARCRCRAGVGARGLPPRVRLARAVLDRARRAGVANPHAPDGRRAQERSSARQVGPDRRPQRCPRRAAGGPGVVFRRAAGRARSWTCGCWSITVSASSATASSSIARCCGICTICGPSCGCRAARCSQRNGRLGSAGGWPGPSRRCAFGSRATSCAGCAS
jgi:hypothetical protein